MTPTHGPADGEDYAEACQVLATRWGVVPAVHAQAHGDYAYLLDELTERVSHLMLHRNQKLMASLYILDISERRYNAAMEAPNHAARARALAQAILERETEKIASRRKYAAAPRPGLDPGAPPE